MEEKEVVTEEQIEIIEEGVPFGITDEEIEETTQEENEAGEE